MSFVLIIQDKRNQRTWSKVVTSLSLVSDGIKFTIDLHSLTLSAVNSVKTSNAEVSFSESFFAEHVVSFSNILPEGFNDTIKFDPSYNFVINAQHLAKLFKNVDASDSNYIRLKVSCHENTTPTLRFKLMIEMESKSLLIKQYQLSYQPVVFRASGIAHFYRTRWTDQTRSQTGYAVSEKVNYMMIKNQILKSFIDSIPFSTEDFKIDVKSDQILFSGYTKQITSEMEYLKQPMSVTITLSLNELTSTNLVQSKNESTCRKTIEFRLKDFKNFINLISVIHPSTDSNSDKDIASVDDTTSSFEIFFRQAGDPILFQFLNGNNITVSYIQITLLLPTICELSESSKLSLTSYQLVGTSSSSVSEKNTGDANTGAKHMRYLPARHNANTITSSNRPLVSNCHCDTHSRDSMPDRHMGITLLRKAFTAADSIHSKHMSSSMQQNSSPTRNGRVSDYVTYGELESPVSRREREGPPTPRRRHNDTTDYSDSENEIDSLVPDSIGPTQLQVRPKSLFD